MPPGWHDFHVAHVYDHDPEGKPLVAKTGSPYLKLVCMDAATGSSVWHLIFLEPDNAKKISALLHACLVDLADGQEITINAETFLGKSFRGKVETNAGFDGVQRNRIVRVIQQEEPAPQEAPAEPPPADPETDTEEVPF